MVSNLADEATAAAASLYMAMLEKQWRKGKDSSFEGGERRYESVKMAAGDFGVYSRV